MTCKTSFRFILKQVSVLIRYVYRKHTWKYLAPALFTCAAFQALLTKFAVVNMTMLRSVQVLPAKLALKQVSPDTENQFHFHK